MRLNFNIVLLIVILLIIGLIGFWTYTLNIGRDVLNLEKDVKQQHDELILTEEEFRRKSEKYKSEQAQYVDFIESRLAETMLNYERTMFARRKLRESNSISTTDPWNFRNWVCIWDLFYPSFDCPHTVERIGRTGDGGKWVCGVNHIATYKRPCVIYSYELSTDISFEMDILEQTNCSIYMFDHTIDIASIKLPQEYPGRAFVEKLGLGVTDTAQLRSIKSTMAKYKHKFIDILKIDVEGAEFEVFNAISKDFPHGLPFGQLQIEIHLPASGDESYVETYANWMQNLEDMGLRPFHFEVNLISASIAKTPNVCEYAYINVKVDNPLLHA